MEPFLISCPSCKIRLQITNPDFIGREFACPKCKTRLEVKEPTEEERASAAQAADGSSGETGHVTGTFRLGPPKNLSQDAITAIGEFADIESVLATGESKPKGKWINQPLPEPATPVDPLAGAKAHREAQQRWTLLIFAIVGGALAALMVTSLVVYILSTNQETKQRVVAQAPGQGDGPNERSESDGGEKEKLVEQEGKLGPEQKPTEEEPRVTISPETKPVGDPSTPPEGAPVKPPAPNQETPTAPPGLTPVEPAAGAKKEGTGTMSNALKDGLQGNSLIPQAGGAGALFKAQGGLLDVPEVDPTIFKPKPNLINVNEQLNVVFAQVRGEKLVLIDFLELLSQLSGTPVSLDPAVYTRATVDPRAEVSVVAEGKNLRQIAETGLRPLGLELVALGGGFVATFPENSQPPPLDLAGITLAPGQSADFEKFVKQSVDSLRWGDPPQGAKLTIVGNQIQFQGPVRVAWGVKNLLDGVRLASSGQAAPPPGDELLKKRIDLKDARTMRLEEWARKLETLADCEILIDWVSLGGLGWNLETVVSQAAAEEPLGEVLRTFCEPRALAYRQLTPRVIEITSFMETYAGADSRVVSIKKQIDAGMPPEKIQADVAKAISPAIPRIADPRVFVQVLKSPPVAAIRGPASVQVLAEKWLSDAAPAAPPVETKPNDTPAPISTAGAGS